MFVDRLLRGGIQTLLLNIVEHIDRDRFDVEFLTLDDGKNYPLEQQLNDLGFHVHRLEGIWIKSPLSYRSYDRELDRFYCEHGPYDVVHMHSSSKNYPILRLAERHGIAVRIAHSHNTGFRTKSLMKVALGNLMMAEINRYATLRFACSHEAGRWMFGPSFPDEPDEEIIHNALEPNRFTFSPQIREEMRDELGLDRQLCILNVARLEPEKNQARLISIMGELVKDDVPAMLLVVGQGTLDQELTAQVRDLDLEDHVRFLGFRDDVTRIMQAADVFAMTSFHEGLPCVAVEAQAAGLPCLFSDAISPDVLILPQSKLLALSAPDAVWARAILSMVASGDRHDTGVELRRAGYDITEEVKRLENIYLKALNSKATF